MRMMKVMTTSARLCDRPDRANRPGPRNNARGSDMSAAEIPAVSESVID